MSKKRMKTRLGADGIDYPYTSESLVFDNKGRSIDQKYATKEDLESLSMVDELEERVSANEESIAWLLENGGGGGGTISCYISTTDAENFIISNGNDLTLHLDFFSPNIGKGTLKVFINDVESKSVTIAQGDTATIIEGDLFNTGSNTMRVYVVDRTGNLTNELTFYVRYGSTQITSTFDPYISYDFGSIIRYYFTVTALDTSDTLTFYIKIDDELQNPISCKSEVRAYFTFPSTLSVGSHYCEAWAEDSVGKSNILKFNIIILDDRAVVVASDTQTLSVEEGSQVSLDYKVYMKNNTTFITKIYIDNEYSSSGTCGLETSFYKTSNLTEGIHTIKLEVWDTTETVSDYVTWTVTITPSTYEMVTATTAGASAIFTAMNRLNSDENRETWIGTNQDGGQIVANLSNFAFNSESGWVDDNLIISGNSAVEIPITPLANNAKYGFTLDIEFTSKAIGVEDALVLKLWDDTNNCGIKITTEELILRSKENNECRLYFTDNENTSVMFIIDRDEGFAKIYLNGVMCEAFHLNDYTVNGVAYLEDFTVNDTIKLGGSGYCQIKNLRVYEIALATNEILNNFISNETNKEAQRMLVEFQKGDNLPTLTIYGDFSGLGKDDKKPCDIVYLSTDVTKYGESFTLSGKTSSLQYQGTSSMAYPIKNYRINLRDSLGNKWKYNPFNGGQPESRFCLKADFITSNHAHNTGMAKFISDKLYNYDVSNESTMNPAKWWSINNGGKLTDTRETINGFPCRLILVNDGDTALNEGQAEPSPGNTKDMGIFNFNNDKDNVATMGLDTDVFPNALSFEVTANSDTSAGAFVPYTPVAYVDITNDGVHYGATSGKIPFSEFGLEIGKPFAYELINLPLFNNSVTVIQLWKTDGSWKKGLQFGATSPLTGVVEDTDIGYITLGFGYGDEITENSAYKIGNIIVKPRFDTVNTGGTTLTIDTSGELEYLQQSFELRYPDEDDVGSDYGYLGLETETVMAIDYFTNSNGNDYTTLLKIGENDLFKYITVSYDNDISTFTFDVYNSNKVWMQTLGPFNCGDSVDPGNYSDFISADGYLAFAIPSGATKITIKGNEYVIKEKQSELTIKNPYLYDGFSKYGLKRVIDWVGNATNEEFVADFDKYFNRHYTLRYYLLVVLMAGVDNLGKNMMLDSFDGQIWYPRFYDIDTILSYDNSGEIKFDVDIEMEQGYWNTSASRLWTKVRDNFHDELVEVYKQMRGNGVTYEQIMHYMYDEQIAKIPQTYYNKDFDIKYAPYADQYIGKAHGDGYEHMKRWLKRRFIFCDTLFDYAPSYENDVLTIRANTLEEMHLTIDTYTPLYQHVSFYNGNMEKIKITPGQPVTFSGFAQTATDQEVLIYGGNNIKKITGISTCNPNSMLIGFAPRLTELDISNCPILTIVNSNKANFSPHTYLNKLNISNCPQLGGNLNVSNSPLLQEINARGSAITGLLLPTSLRNLKTLELPNTISSLALYDAGVLENLKFDEGVAMQSIELSNCPGITNTENFDLTQTPTVILDNSYDTEELYMSATTNLTLRNMKNMERVIYTPNEEYSEFDINNVINGKNYKITTSSCPKLSTFMTTAPHRLSYNGDEYKQFIEASEKIYTVSDMIENHCINYLTGADMDNNSFCRLPYTEVYEGDTIKVESTHISGSDPSCWVILYDHNKGYRGAFSYNRGNGEYNTTNGEVVVLENGYMRIRMADGDTDGKIYHTRQSKTIMTKDITPNTVFTANTLDLSATQFTDIKLLCTTDVYNLKVPTTMKNFYCDSAMDIDTDVIEDASYEVIHEELIEPYTTNYEGEVVRKQVGYNEGVVITKWNEGYKCSNTTGKLTTDASSKASDLIEVVGGTNLTVVSGVQEVYQYDESETLIYYSNSSRNLQSNTKYIRVQADLSATNVTISYTGVSSYTPNILPSSANGSLIFNMYSNNTTQPTSTSPYMWDLTGLKLNDFYTYGMNNNVKASDDSYVPICNDKNLMKIRGNGGNGATNGTIYADPNSNKYVIKINLDGATRIDFKTNMAEWQMFPYYYDASPGIQRHPGYALSQTLTGHAITGGDTIVEFQATCEWFAIKTNLSTEWIYFYLEDIPTLDLPYGTYNIDDYVTTVKIYEKLGEKYIGNPSSITMPQRMPGYSVRLVNADITPNEYPTMLYPKWIDISLPITGKLDYTAYNGTSLAWAYAYTTEDVEISPLGSREMGQITFDYNKLYSTDYVDVRDVWIYKDTDKNNLSTNEAITEAYIELTSDNYKTRVDEVLAYYPNCTDLYFFDDGVLNNLSNWFDNCSYKGQIEHITFMEGYFKNVTSLYRAMRSVGNLLTVSNIPNGVTNMESAFYCCVSLTQAPAIPSSVTKMGGTFQGCFKLTTAPAIPQGVTDMGNTFNDCKALTTAPIIPSSVTNMHSTFYNCTALTTAPAIPQGVRDMTRAFQGCTSLTQAPAIPNSVTSINNTFFGCKALTTAPPTIPSSVTNMNSAFCNCSSLTTVPVISQGVTNMGGAFQNCTSLTTPPTIGSSVTNMASCFYGCTSLTQAPTIPSGVTSMNQTFENCKSLVDISLIIPSTCTAVNSLFRGCTSLENVNLIGSDTSNVTTMQRMFNDCIKLTTIVGFENLNVDKVTNIFYMYWNCSCNIIYIPLTCISEYGGAIALYNLENGNIPNIIWCGVRSTNFDTTLLGKSSIYPITQADIQELVPEHLGDLHKDEIKISFSNKKITINNTETTWE